MSPKLKTISVDPESETGRLLDEVAESAFVLESDGSHFLVTRVDHGAGVPALEVIDDGTVWRPHDPERVRAILDATIGAWADVDAEELKDYLYRARDRDARLCADE